MKKILWQLIFSLAFCVLSSNTHAQTNNLCPVTSVSLLTVNDCTNGDVNYNVANAFTVDPTGSAPTSSCANLANNKRDGWFRFVATQTSTTIIGTVENSRNLAMAIYSGACGSMTELACMNAGGNGATETITLTTVIGTTYYIRLMRYSATTGDMTGTVEVFSLVNDNCSGAIALTPSAPGGACAPVCGTDYNATASTPATACSGTAEDDVWYSFVATQVSHVVTVQGLGDFDAVIGVLSGGCGALTNIACIDATGDGNSESLTLNNLIAGNNYYIRVYDDDNNQPSSRQFRICVTTPVLPTCPAGLGLGVVNVASLPYTSSGRTTTGRGNEITALNSTVCGNSNYYQGNDEVFIFTPAVSGNISVTLTSGSTNVGIMLYNGCPFIGSSGTCVEYSQSTSGNQFFCANVTAGTTYYLVVDRNSGSAITSYNITITAPNPVLAAGSTCAVAITATLPFNTTSQTTQCKGNDYNTGSTGSCMSLYESGEDMVYSLTVGAAQCIRIALTNTSSIQAGFQLYENCPGTAGANCLGAIGGGNVSGNFSLPNGGTFYIIVDSWGPPTSVTYDLSITSVSGSTGNDLPCFATALPLYTNVNGDNSCSNGSLEPGAPSCWSSGALNTVWYTVIPTGTSLIIKTFLGTLSNTQIALYQGTCNSLTQVTPTGSSCSNNISCGSNSTLNSQITVTGLTPGNTYYVRVDGEIDKTGTFGILAVDGAGGLPTVYGQDCESSIAVCQNSLSVGNPGFSAFGNYCDFTNGINCLNSGERSGSWYYIPIGTNGLLEFDIVPNDWFGAPSTTSTDYDFAIWEIGNSGLQCSQLNSVPPNRCNYSALGVTGIAGTGNSPGAYPGFNGSYESGINATVGQVYLLFVSNYTNSTSGFTLNFVGSPDPVDYFTAPGSVTWYGGTNTSWSVPANWGACDIPNCSIDAFVDATSINQPVIAANQTVKDLVINAGATLTLNAGITLSICGDFTNSGSFIAQPGSIVKFIGTGTQNIYGSFTGVNSFANFTMQKASGSLIAQTTLQINETDSLKSGLFVPNSNDIYLGRNLYNANGSSTHTSPLVAGKYEFIANGVNQTFTNIGDNITFFNVIMNQVTTNSLILGAGLNNDLRVGGTLTLTQGKIVTGAKQVHIINQNNNAVTAGIATSYVEGNLRRALLPSATGAYDFPVGHSTSLFQRATINFTAATSIPELVAYFTPWGAVPVGPVSSECVVTNYALNPALNNGYWSFNASANSNTGVYTMTLNNANYSNATPSGGFSIMKRVPISSGPWGLDGTCVITSTATSTQRTAMIGFNGDFATAQSLTPLPIELIRFEAQINHEGVMTSWTTATEINNDFFSIERSYDGMNFTLVGIVDGAGNSTQDLNYSLLDRSPGIGIVYYRLKQTDFDFKYTYSAIVAVKIKDKISGLNIYPNPAENNLNLQFESTGEPVTIKLIDEIGREVYNEEKVFGTGNITTNLKLNQFADGVYMIIVTCNGSISKNWFVKKN